MKKLGIILALVAILVLAGCRNETQNRIRRNIQEFTSGQMYITIYTIEGATVFEGVVDGKVTRASTTSEGSNQPAAGSYVFWFDEAGRYHQTDLPYLVTSYRRTPGQEPATPSQ